MNRTEHLLTIIAEECAEVAQRATKAARFGLYEIQPGQELTNIERLKHEYNDLIAAIEMLESNEKRSINREDFLVYKKQCKIADFLKYSNECGTLD